MSSQKQQTLSRYFSFGAAPAPKPKPAPPPPQKEEPKEPENPKPITPVTPKRRLRRVVDSESSSSSEDFDFDSDPEFIPKKKSKQEESSESSESESDVEMEEKPAKKSGTGDFSNLNLEYDEKRHKAFVAKLHNIPRMSGEEEGEKKKKGEIIGNGKLTPMEQQVVEMKQKYPDCVLAFEVGYKYKLFGKDAELANKLLNVCCFQDHNFMTAMIPTVRVYFHLRRIVKAGYKVGLVQQKEVAALKAVSDNKNKPFTRELSAFYTPATLVGSELGSLDFDPEDRGHFILSITERENANALKISFVAADISTGDVIYETFDDSTLRSLLDTVIAQVSISEVVMSPTLSEETQSIVKRLKYRGVMIHPVNESIFDIQVVRHLRRRVVIREGRIRHSDQQIDSSVQLVFGRLDHSRQWCRR